MRRILALAVLVLAAAAPAQAQEARTVILKERLFTSDGVITLSDLFENAGDAGGAVLARAPSPGQRLSLDTAFIQAQAAREGLVWNNAGSVMRVTVERAAREVPASDIRAMIEEALYVESGQAHAVELSNRSQSLYAPLDSAGGPELVSFDHDRPSGLFRAQISPWPGATPETLSGRAHPVVDVPVLTRAIARGETITGADIEWTRLPSDRVRAETLTTRSALEGMQARRALRPGQPLRGYDIQAPVMISRGEIVSLVYQAGGLLLSARARALDNVANGEPGRFVNLQSNRTVEAVADGPGRARIAAASGGAFPTH